MVPIHQAVFLMYFYVMGINHFAIVNGSETIWTAMLMWLISALNQLRVHSLPSPMLYPPDHWVCPANWLFFTSCWLVCWMNWYNWLPQFIDYHHQQTVLHWWPWGHECRVGGSWVATGTQNDRSKVKRWGKLSTLFRGIEILMQFMSNLPCWIVSLE